jgi:type I restriction enzyme, S subunit
MRKGWTSMTLDEVCDFTNGLWKGEKPPFLTIGVIRNTNFTKEGALDSSDIAYIEVEAKKLEKRRLKFGDIILEKSGGGPKQPVGRVVLFDKQDGDFSFSNFTAALRVRDHGEVDLRYLHKFLHWTYLSGVTERIQSHSTGIRNLNGDAYKAIAFNYPPLPEQQRIVALLDDAFAGLATAKSNAERNLQNARAIFESHLQSVFSQRGEGWVDTTLGDATGGIFTGPFGSLLHKSDYVEGGIPLVNPAHITATGIEPDLCKTVSVETATRLRSYIMSSGDIVIGRRGEMGRCAVVTEREDGWLCGTGSFFVKPSSRCDTRYLVRYLRSESCKSMLQEIAGGAVMPNLSNTDLGSLSIYLPPLDKQIVIVEHVDCLHAETQRLTRLYERKLAALEELKKSLLHQAFNGEL